MNSSLNDMILKAMENGYIVYDELLPFFDKGSPELRRIINKLQEENVEIIAHEEALEEDKVDEVEVDNDLSKLSKSNDSLTSYIQDIKTFPLLTMEEEVELGNEIKDGVQSKITLEKTDLSENERSYHEMVVERAEAAKEYFINCNLRLVVWWSAKYRNKGLAQEDLIQEGNMGLMKAVDKFEPDKGVRFSTYASNWIRKSMMRAIQNQARTVRLPIHISSYISKMKRIEKNLEAEYGRMPTVEEVADEMGEKVERVIEIQGYINDKISLDMTVGDEDATSLGDLVSNTTTPTPYEEIVNYEYNEELKRLLLDLNPKEYQVINLRYGLKDGIARTLEEIGRAMNLTRERVRQIEAKALRKLRHPSRSEKIKQFLQV
ncbi:MAG: sigma-70 family RNA polymerase sigma factor [Bacilli bacterium]|jgi:RNA polymerase primary sigma factor|nr:sigma-70 family RNA polymerase sigma factor [Bacilli bacterium]MDY0064065.1 sigma-70 family RNA polymerase sigma factor [Bacilli bacterium]